MRDPVIPVTIILRFGAPLDVSNLSGLFGYIGMAMFMFRRLDQ